MFDWPLVGWLCHITGQIPVHRRASDRVALELALAYLREGRVIVIFPEGTVERKEQMIPAHSGVAMLALRLRCYNIAHRTYWNAAGAAHMAKLVS